MEAAKNTILSFPVYLLAIVLFLPNNVFSGTEFAKTKGLMAAGSYLQAIPLLDRRSKDNPEDSEAHYLLGVCFIKTGKYKGAKESFASAVVLDKGYGTAIGREYIKVGSAALKRGTYGMAGILFKRAIEYDPDLQVEIGRQYFEVGKSFLSQQQSSTADHLFAIAVRHDPSLREEISSITSQ